MEGAGILHLNTSRFIFVHNDAFHSRILTVHKTRTLWYTANYDANYTDSGQVNNAETPVPSQWRRTLLGCGNEDLTRPYDMKLVKRIVTNCSGPGNEVTSTESVLYPYKHLRRFSELSATIKNFGNAQCSTCYVLFFQRTLLVTIFLQIICSGFARSTATVAASCRRLGKAWSAHWRWFFTQRPASNFYKIRKALTTKIKINKLWKLHSVRRCSNWTLVINLSIKLHAKNAATWSSWYDILVEDHYAIA